MPELSLVKGGITRIVATINVIAKAAKHTVKFPQSSLAFRPCRRRNGK